MKLTEYLRTENLKPAPFAASIGVPASTISRLLSGDRKPGLDLMMAIRKGTNNKVTLDEIADEFGQLQEAAQ